MISPLMLGDVAELDELFDKRYAGRCTPQGCFFGQSRQVIATLTKRF